MRVCHSTRSHRDAGKRSPSSSGSSASSARTRSSTPVWRFWRRRAASASSRACPLSSTANSPVEAAEVDQVLDHPAAGLLVLGHRRVRSLGPDERQQPAHDFGLGGTVVEIHCQRDLVGRLEPDLGHLVALGVGEGEARLARVEVVQRRRAGEGIHAAGETVVAPPRHTRLHAARAWSALTRRRRPPGGRGRTSTRGSPPRCGPVASSRRPTPGHGPTRARRTGTAARCA